MASISFQVKVIAERSERIITMITINLEFSKWPEMFKDATLVAALVDCLTYHSHGFLHWVNFMPPRFLTILYHQGNADSIAESDFIWIFIHSVVDILLK